MFYARFSVNLMAVRVTSPRRCPRRTGRGRFSYRANVCSVNVLRVLLIDGGFFGREETGRLIARFHRAGLDHADLNAHNILFDANGHGWLIDFDRGVQRIPATAWRERNLKRLHRSLVKLRGERSHDEVEKDFARLRRAYDLAWNRGY